MKQTISLFLIILAISQVHGQALTASIPVSAQSIAFTNSVFTGSAFDDGAAFCEYGAPHLAAGKKRRSAGVRLGKTFLIAGGAQLAAAGLLELTVTPSKDIFTGFIEEISFAILVADGIAFACAGGISYLFGSIHEHNHPGRYSLVTKRNQLGLAYNF